MNNFKLLFNHADYGYFELDLETVISAIGDEKFMSFSENASSLQSDWEPVTWVFIENDGDHLPDITSWGFGCLALSERAKEILQEYIISDGEFLQLQNQKYWIFNCLSRAFANADKSTALIDRGVYAGIKSLKFDASSTIEKHIFKTDFDHYSGFYCSETVKDLIEQNSLTGVKVTSNLSESEV